MPISVPSDKRLSPRLRRSYADDLGHRRSPADASARAVRHQGNICDRSRGSEGSYRTGKRTKARPSRWERTGTRARAAPEDAGCVILVDTSVWVDHFRAGLPALVKCLEQSAVATQPFVIGELALGNVRQRGVVLEWINALSAATVAQEAEVLAFIEHK